MPVFVAIGISDAAWRRGVVPYSLMRYKTGVAASGSFDEGGAWGTS